MGLPQGLAQHAHVHLGDRVAVGLCVLQCQRAQHARGAALDAVVAKHTPQHVGTAYPENMLKMTAVVEITIHEITGKYYA